MFYKIYYKTYGSKWEMNGAKYKILNYMLNKGSAYKLELARELDLSMPTVLTNTNELMEQGLLVEMEETKSTGGRRARAIGIQKDYCYSVGVNITANHIGMVLVNFGGEIVAQKRMREQFQPTVAYLSRLAHLVKDFYSNEVAEERVLGIGISLPGIVNAKDKMLIKSHALKLENYNLKLMEQLMPLSVHFENDANAAMLSENPETIENIVYLSLNNTLGGAVCTHGKLFVGDNRKAGEVGHMLLKPNGKQCYCGKRGCADAYCAANVLTQNGKETLEGFMESIEKDKEASQRWKEYLENLAMLISNIRMFLDTDIMLGGEVGGYLGDYMMDLGEKIFKYNLFDGDISYLKNCSYKKEASAVGVAKYFFGKYIEQI